MPKPPPSDRAEQAPHDGSSTPSLRSPPRCVFCAVERAAPGPASPPATAVCRLKRGHLALRIWLNTEHAAAGLEVTSDRTACPFATRGIAPATVLCSAFMPDLG